VWSWSVVWVVKTCVVVAAGYDLEGMTVEMEGVSIFLILVYAISYALVRYRHREEMVVVGKEGKTHFPGSSLFNTISTTSF
jgi:hypothetical protein